MQHDATGPLSAMLPYKFLYDLNVKSGNHGYIEEVIRFYIMVGTKIPLELDGESLKLIEKTAEDYNGENNLPVVSTNHSLILQFALNRKITRSMLSSEQLLQIKMIRKNYRAQSQHPKQLEKYFDNVHDNVTNNEINVVSDFHATKGVIDLVSPNFNIIAGDLSDSLATDEELHGIAVIGNHDIVECELGSLMNSGMFNALSKTTDIDYSKIRIDDCELYTKCKAQLEKRYSKVTFLNNQSYFYNGVRYIGLSIPVCYIRQKYQAQDYMFNILEQLLHVDKTIPTVIISHAPLFNELSLLSPNSKNYNQDFNCVNEKIIKLFEDYNILGVIHGHHHISASSGVIDIRTFSSKKIFVICSIYSYLNKGFDLQRVLNEMRFENRNQRLISEH